MSEKEVTSWKKLAEEKEKEWRSILESRIEELESNLNGKTKELENEREKLYELKEHFKYNLKLLQERDLELEKFESSHSELRASINCKNAEISELKIKLDDVKSVIKREEKMRDELQVNYQKRLREKQSQIDVYKSHKDSELHGERQEYEEFRRNIQNQLTRVQSELETQNRELTLEFENELKKREHEFKVEMDALSAKCLEHELKCKILEKELEMSKESSKKSSAVAEEAETSQRQLEKQVKQKEWEIADLTSANTFRISELETKLASAESAMKKMQEDYQRKYSELDKNVREKEDKLERQKNGYLEKEQDLQQTIRDLQSKIEDFEIEKRQTIWAHQDEIKEKETHIERLQDELTEVKQKWDRHVAEISRDHVSRDLELATALEEQRRLKLELDERKEDLKRYKNELELATARETKLDRDKSQVELDWQRRCEDLERQQYDKSEDLIKRLMTARDEAQAVVKEQDRELHHKVLLIKSLHTERDQLRSLLKSHGIPLDHFVKYSIEKQFDQDDISHMEQLQKQNSDLRDLIGQMTRQMEALGKSPKQNNSDSNQNRHTQNNETDESMNLLLEKVKDLKKENEELREKLKRSKHVVIAPPSKEAHDKILQQVGSNSNVRDHIVTLHEAMGSLRTEKVSMAASLKKLQARVAYLESSLEESSKQPRLKQIQIDQLNYELNTGKKRHENEVSGLKSRVTELELQLGESRREADEYHRSSLERNQEVIALGNQLSALKLQISESQPSVNYGAQELYIQQLQTELTQLRKRSAAITMSSLSSDNKLAALGAGDSKDSLRGKLKLAATKIVQLAKENQQLIESNNKLRSQTNASYTKDREDPRPSTLEVEDSSTPEKEEPDNKADRLQQLEKLQYQLTRQELTFAQKYQPKKTASVNNRNVADIVEETVDIQQSELKNTSRSREPAIMDPTLLVSMSSAGGESIERVWEMLDSIPTSSPASHRSFMSETAEKDNGNDPIDENDNFYVEGQKVKSYRKEPKPKVIIAPAVFPQKERRTKIRNYNLKDDTINLR